MTLMRRGYNIAALLYILFLLSACQEEKAASLHVKRSGDLPVAAHASVFQPEAGKYAQLFRDESWQVFIDGAQVADFEQVESANHIIADFHRDESAQARNAVVLVSSSASTPMHEMRRAVMLLASYGINPIYFHVQSPAGVKSGFRPRVFQLDLNCMHCQLVGHELLIEPLLIKVNEDGAVLAEREGKDSELDGPEALGDLPLLSEVLQIYCESVEAVNSAPLVRVRMSNGAPYQRWVDLMTILQAQEMIVEWTDLSEDQ